MCARVCVCVACALLWRFRNGTCHVLILLLAVLCCANGRHSDKDCVQCPVNSKVLAGPRQCQCQQGYTCAGASKCPKGVFDPIRETGMTCKRDVALCASKTCPKNAKCNPADGMCECAAGSYFNAIKTFCASCPADSVLTTRWQTTMCRCTSGFVCKGSPGCSSGETFDPHTAVAARCLVDKCSAKACHANSKCNPSTGQCQCDSGFEAIQGTTKCSRKCPADSTRLKQAETCQCESGFECQGSGGCNSGNNQFNPTSATQAFCRRADLCANVKCPDKAECDTGDGNCRCKSGTCVTL